jgi:hypothetical protein
MDEQRIFELRSMDYDKYLETPEWAEKREQALERDGYRCRVCNTDKNLHVHHRTYARRGNEDPNDLTTLCDVCHEAYHKRVAEYIVMAKTYNKPRKETTPAERNQKWEQAIIGLLIQQPDTWSYVCGIINEGDFLNTETQALYRIINAIYPEKKLLDPIEEFVPAELMPEVAIITEMSQRLFPTGADKDELVREIVQIATRLKKNILMQKNLELKERLQKAVADGDKELVKQIQTQFVAIQRQLLTLNSATRLQR